ncbi:hypothetical protein D9611_008108 [Ephemerocybe angulata]|uniref:Intradiol ring-cleavage dioxygenase n=2 Tax=Ephemerocybe angulata TaxID=980116 RepID=A0A8H6HCN6_9AGAR|nr:hypothetical protein D9611_008108 [Tulosesus angulatus]KAF6744523.1 Intradiol ring-cleavage dioxygenase [Tulosesus angulatus]
MRFLSLASLLAVVGYVCAHGTPDEYRPTTTEELISRNRAMEARNLATRKCAGEIAAFEAERMAKRDRLMKRQWTPTSTAATPHYTTIQNSTCVLHPETVEGPYYIRNELIRTDLRETQAGVSLVLDIGLINSRTCQPMSNAFIELWAANSVGIYGGYPNGQPTGVKTQSFLRGGYFTDSNGIVELTTIYPGFYQGRTAHIHALVHNNWKGNTNGTLISDSGSVNHFGQFFFDETWNTRVFATAPYNTNKQIRTLNAQDFILQQAGKSSFVNLQYLSGSTLTSGLLGYITVVVDGNANYRIQNNNSL